MTFLQGFDLPSAPIIEWMYKEPVMQKDPFHNSSGSLIAPSDDCFTIVPDDLLDIARATKAIYIGTGGDVTLRPLRSESDVVFRNLVSGSILDVRVGAVRATGTTASDIVGLA
jgi:hypothetical protein